MTIKKGTVLNPAGRPSGAVNKSSAEIRAAFQMLVENNLETLEQDLKIVKPDQRINFILKMAEFFLPKLMAQKIEVDLNTLTEIQIEQIINSININDNE